MEYALSLKTGEHISAVDLSESAAYRASLKFLLVCPECGEPVHFRQREFPYNTPFFSHYKQSESTKAIRECSLRTQGASIIPASQAVPGIKHGQAVDRFQRDFYKTFYALFEKYSDELFVYLKLVEQQILSSKNYFSFINSVEKEFKNSCVARAEFSCGDSSIAESVSDLCLFLKSGYGNWVGNVLYRIAHFVAINHQSSAKETEIGRVPITIAGQFFVFALDGYKLRTQIKSHPKSRVSELVLVQISSALLGYTILKWRIPASRIDLITTKIFIEINKEFTSTPQRTNAATQSFFDPSILKHVRENNNKAVAIAIQVGAKNEQEVISKRWPNTSPHTDNLIVANADTSMKNADENQKPNRKSNAVTEDGLNSTFRVAADSDVRIYSLINEAKRLPPPKGHLETREEILAWSSKRNPIEAYFLAAFNGVPHTPPKFSDPTLSARLREWLERAKNLD